MSNHDLGEKNMQQQSQHESINRAVIDRLRELARAAMATSRHRAIPHNAAVAIERAAVELEYAARIIAEHAVALDGSEAVRPIAR